MCVGGGEGRLVGRSSAGVLVPLDQKIYLFFSPRKDKAAAISVETPQPFAPLFFKGKSVERVSTRSSHLTR